MKAVEAREKKEKDAAQVKIKGPLPLLQYGPGCSWQGYSAHTHPTVPSLSVCFCAPVGVERNGHPDFGDAACSTRTETVLLLRMSGAERQQSVQGGAGVMHVDANDCWVHSKKRACRQCETRRALVRAGRGREGGRGDHGGGAAAEGARRPRGRRRRAQGALPLSHHPALAPSHALWLSAPPGRPMTGYHRSPLHEALSDVLFACF